MINSPCMNCPSKKMPKDECIKTCETLQEIQRYQTKLKEFAISKPIDYTEETSILISKREFGY